MALYGASIYSLLVSMKIGKAVFNLVQFLAFAKNAEMYETLSEAALWQQHCVAPLFQRKS